MTTPGAAFQSWESRNSILALVKNEGLPAWQKGNIWRAHSDELEAWSLEWAKRQQERNVQNT